jgi:hypothetical protein
MATPRQIRAMHLYREIMDEIRIRLAAIDTGTGGYLVTLPPAIVREHCFLQIRMICELIALGCLVAHGDIEATQTKKLQTQWAADKIIGELERLHPDFYPAATKQTLNPHGYDFNPVHPSPCTKSDLLRIYYKCGDILHRGDLKRFLSQNRPTVVNYREIISIAQKLNDLLATHIVFTISVDLMFICVLRARDNNLTAQVAIAERPTPPILLP